jgi:methyl-accepting chemotaxis protein
VFTSFQRRPIAQQLMILTMAVLFAIFAILTLVVQRNADSAALTVAEHNLEHEARIMAGMLDSIFESVKDRGERQSQFFLKYVGGTPTVSPESSKVGDVELPIVRVGSEVMNANLKPLQAFKDLTGEETAFWSSRMARSIAYRPCSRTRMASQ